LSKISKNFNSNLNNKKKISSLEYLVDNNKKLINIIKLKPMESNLKVNIDPETVQIIFKKNKKDLKLRKESFWSLRKKNFLLKEFNSYSKNFFIYLKMAPLFTIKGAGIVYQIKFFIFKTQFKIFELCTTKKFRENKTKNSYLTFHFIKSYNKISIFSKNFLTFIDTKWLSNFYIKKFKKYNNQFFIEKKLKLFFYIFNFISNNPVKITRYGGAKLPGLKNLGDIEIKCNFLKELPFIRESVLTVPFINLKYFLKTIYSLHPELKKSNFRNVSFLKRFHIIFLNKDFLIIYLNSNFYDKIESPGLFKFEANGLKKSIYHLSFIFNCLSELFLERSFNRFSRYRLGLFDLRSYDLHWVLLSIKKILLEIINDRFFKKIHITYAKYILSKTCNLKKKFKNLLKVFFNFFSLQRLTLDFKFNFKKKNLCRNESNYNELVKVYKINISNMSKLELSRLDFKNIFIKFYNSLVFYYLSFFNIKYYKNILRKLIQILPKDKLFLKRITDNVFFFGIGNLITFYILIFSKVFNHKFEELIKTLVILKFFPFLSILGNTFFPNRLKKSKESKIYECSRLVLFKVKSRESQFFKRNSIVYKILIRGQGN